MWGEYQHKILTPASGKQYNFFKFYLFQFPLLACGQNSSQHEITARPFAFTICHVAGACSPYFHPSKLSYCLLAFRWCQFQFQFVAFLLCLNQNPVVKWKYSLFELQTVYLKKNDASHHI